MKARTSADVEKVGWRFKEWCPATGVSRSYAYELLGAGKIKAVKAGAATIITTSPSEYLASLSDGAA
jgi:hypothetical protein